MQFQIQIDQRMDKMRTVVEAVKTLTDNFLVLTCQAYSGNTHRPVQIISFNSDEDIDFGPCIEKLKKIVGGSPVLVTRCSSPVKPKGLTAHSAFLKDENQTTQSPAFLKEENQTSQSSGFLEKDKEDETPQSPAFLEEKDQTTQNPTSSETSVDDDAPNVGAE